MDTVTITSGIYRGRKIATPGGATHPMGSREKLALFNMLTGKIEGVSVLDAFAGSGALGIEALSRGASEVVFVEKSARACETIRKNLKTLGVESGFKVIKNTVSKVSNDLEEFEVILADPPYDDFEITEVKKLVPLLKNSGVLVLSHPGEAPDLAGLSLLKTHSYAGANLSIYAKN